MIKILALFLVINWPADINDISKVNTLKEKAADAFNTGNFEKAAEHYSYLLDTLQIEDERAMMNLANSYYQIGKTELAQNHYNKLTLSKSGELKSAAYQQLGALSKDPQTLEKALAYFKESIKSDPANDDSRYNYELVKRKIQEQQKQQQDQNQQNEDQNQDQDQENEQNQDQDQQNKDQQKDQQQKDQENQDQQNQDQQNQEQQDQEQQNQDQQQQQENQDQENKEEEQQQNQQQQEQEGQKKDEEQEKTPQQQTAEKLKEMNISEEKAKMILEALKNNEIQYIQQNRRKATKRKETGKPDW